jgi:hypothetical protein
MIPVVGWILGGVLWTFAGIPIYYLWNFLAPLYFYWLPKIYLDLPFWHVVGLLWLLSALKALWSPIVKTNVKTDK